MNQLQHDLAGARRALLAIAAVISVLTASLSCGGRSSAKSISSVPSLVHLDSELPRARVTSAPAPASARERHAWNFAEPQPEWRPISSANFPGLAAVELHPLQDSV